MEADVKKLPWGVLGGKRVWVVLAGRVPGHRSAAFLPKLLVGETSFQRSFQ